MCTVFIKKMVMEQQNKLCTCIMCMSGLATSYVICCCHTKKSNITQILQLSTVEL